MARIPLADIPNAVQPVAMPTGGNLSGANLSTAQSLLSQPTIAKDAFQGPSKGLQSIATSLGVVGASAGKIAEHLHKAEVEDQAFQAESQYRQAWSDYESKRAENPGADPKQWVGDWMEQHKSVTKEILANKDLSDDAKRRINQIGVDYWDKTSGALKVEAGKTLWNRATTAELQRKDWAIEAQDFDGARKMIDSMAASRRIFPEQAEGLHHDVNVQQDVSKAMAGMQMNPEATMESLKDEALFPHLDPLRRKTLTDQARVEFHRQDSDKLQRSLEEIDNLQTTTEEQQRQKYGDEFFARHKAALSRALKGEFKFEPEKFMEVQQELTNTRFDTMSKPERQLAEQKLITLALGNIPPGRRESILNDIHEAANLKPSSMVKKVLVESLTKARDAGFFGSFNEDDMKSTDKATSGKALSDYNKANAEMYDTLTEAEKWEKGNPSATPKQASDWVAERMSSRIVRPEPGWWQRVQGAKPGDPVPSPVPAPGYTPPPAPVGTKIDETLKRYKSKPTAQSGEGKVTSYGYADDPHTDSNSRKGIGAFGNLPPDGLAVSPDVESKLRGKGLQPGDKVQIELANGSKVVRTWQDRTMQDDEAIRKHGKPYRGRWDFYSPGGIHPADGIEVRAWNKVEKAS